MLPPALCSPKWKRLTLSLWSGETSRKLPVEKESFFVPCKPRNLPCCINVYCSAKFQKYNGIPERCQVHESSMFLYPLFLRLKRRDKKSLPPRFFTAKKPSDDTCGYKNKIPSPESDGKTRSSGGSDDILHVFSGHSNRIQPRNLRGSQPPSIILDSPSQLKKRGATTILRAVLPPKIDGPPRFFTAKNVRSNVGR